MALQQFRLPDPGEGLVEAEIVTWRVAVGDHVQVNDIVVEVETSKSLVELPSPYAGTVQQLLVAEGDTVDVGKPIIAIEDGLDAGTPSEAAVPEADVDAVPEAVPENVPEADVDAAVTADEVAEEGAPGGRVAVLVGYGPRTTEAKRRPRKSARGDAGSGETHQQAADIFSTAQPVSRRADARTPLPPDQAEAVGAPLPRPGMAEQTSASVHPTTLAKPPVRKLAKDLGVELDSITGSGPGGVITRDDVEVAARRTSEEGASARDLSLPTASEVAGDTRIPIKGVRKATARAMVQSAFTAPHVTEWLTCDVSATMELVERLKDRRELADVRVSPLLIVARAVCLALRSTPELNSTWDEQAGEIVLHRSVNLGIAAATPRGLLVPNVKGADAMGLLELGVAISDLVSVARAGTTQPAATSGGTFTITNVGVFGIDAGTPILNPGEAGILCFGQIARRPWVVADPTSSVLSTSSGPSTNSGGGERIEPRWVTTLAISFDHRLVDGEQGSRFLADVAGILADPGLALLYR